LEVGCGSGFLSRLLAKALAGVRIVGLDSDINMLNIASEMREREDLTEQIKFGQGNAFHLPFPDNYFGQVTSHRLL
jgi:ubiquinone/menaquinone biosynthesis C-methylase UbiE